MISTKTDFQYLPLDMILDRVELSGLQIPDFHRAVFWKKYDVISLFNSIAKEYYLGAIIVSRPYDYLPLDCGSRHIGGERECRHPWYNIIDGVQRMSVLYNCLSKNGTRRGKYDLYYDTLNNQFVYPTQKNLSATLIPVWKVYHTFELMECISDIEFEVKDKYIAQRCVDNARKLNSTLGRMTVTIVEMTVMNDSEFEEIYRLTNKIGSTKSWKNNIN